MGANSSTVTPCTGGVLSRRSAGKVRFSTVQHNLSMATEDTSARQLLDDLVERISDRVRRHLARLTLPAPAYAVALVPAEDLFPFAVCVGLDPDREKARASLPPVIAFSAIWQSGEFAIQDVLDDDDEIDEHVTAVESQVQGSDVVDGMGSWSYILGKVARRITLEPPLAEVTDDFAAFFAFAGDIDDLLLDSLRYSISPRVADLLRAKRLHPDDFEHLPGAREWIGDEAADGLGLPPEPDDRCSE